MDTQSAEDLIASLRSRVEEFDQALRHFENVRIRLESRRTVASATELPSIDDLIALNEDRLRLLQTGRDAAISELSIRSATL